MSCFVSSFVLVWLPMPDTDPVCGRSVDTRLAVFKIEYGKITFYFCSEKCMKDFGADPTKYVR